MDNVNDCTECYRLAALARQRQDEAWQLNVKCQLLQTEIDKLREAAAADGAKICELLERIEDLEDEVFMNDMEVNSEICLEDEVRSLEHQVACEAKLNDKLSAELDRFRALEEPLDPEREPLPFVAIGQTWRNTKTSQNYVVINVGALCKFGDEWKETVSYSKCDGRVFTRRITDFYANFEPVEVGQK